MKTVISVDYVAKNIPETSIHVCLTSNVTNRIANCSTCPSCNVAKNVSFKHTQSFSQYFLKHYFRTHLAEHSLQCRSIKQTHDFSRKIILLWSQLFRKLFFSLLERLPPQRIRDLIVQKNVWFGLLNCFCHLSLFLTEFLHHLLFFEWQIAQRIRLDRLYIGYNRIKSWEIVDALALDPFEGCNTSRKQWIGFIFDSFKDAGDLTDFGFNKLLDSVFKVMKSFMKLSLKLSKLIIDEILGFLGSYKSKDIPTVLSHKFVENVFPADRLNCTH